jgi:glycerol kinase
VEIRKANALNMTYGGHVIMMGGAAVDWMTKLIKVICHSSAEAEVSAGCKAAKRMQFIRALVNVQGARSREWYPRGTSVPD